MYAVCSSREAQEDDCGAGHYNRSLKGRKKFLEGMCRVEPCKAGEEKKDWAIVWNGDVVAEEERSRCREGALSSCC